VDPIGIVFFGDGITSQNQQEMMQYHLPVLEPGTAADRQSTISFAASCDAMDADSQTDCGDCDRGHIRVNYVGSPQYFQFAAGQVVSTGQSVVVGTPHTELWDEDCKPGPLGIGSKGGHRTIDYNGARNAVTLAMASEHPWEAALYNNTHWRIQCPERDASYARSEDGLVNYVYTWPLSNPPPPCEVRGIPCP
jgi:hypothetical protein